MAVESVDPHRVRPRPSSLCVESGVMLSAAVYRGAVTAQRAHWSGGLLFVGTTRDKIVRGAGGATLAPVPAITGCTTAGGAQHAQRRAPRIPVGPAVVVLV